jgi:hypothetical protein
MREKRIAKAKELRQAIDTFKLEKYARTLKYKGKGDPVPHKVYADLYEVLWKYGLDSVQAAQAYYDSVCCDVLEYYLPIQGECDFCKGYDGTPPCLVTFGDKSCVSKQRRVMDKEQSYKDMLGSFRMLKKAGWFATMSEAADIFPNIPKMNLEDDSKMVTHNRQVDYLQDYKKVVAYAIRTKQLYTFCPIGHGYYHEYSRSLKDMPIDILWEA